MPTNTSKTNIKLRKISQIYLGSYLKWENVEDTILKVCKNSHRI